MTGVQTCALPICFTFDQQQSDAKYLTGSVVFEHDGAVLTCDTALFFEVDERIQASGNIRITKGDSVSATSNQLEYSGKTRMARMISKVKLIENKLRLETDTLDFNLKSGKAYYTHSALSHYLDNSFISKQGFYNSRLKKLEFLNEVILKNVDYTKIGRAHV